MLIPLTLIPSQNPISVNSDKIIKTTVEPFKFDGKELSIAVIIHMENGSKVIYDKKKGFAEASESHKGLVDHINKYLAEEKK